MGGDREQGFTMLPTVSQLLEPLERHWDRIVRTPLSAAQVEELERQVGLPVPAPLREYLLAVGLFQDLTWGTSSIEVYDSTAEFASTRAFLTGLLPPKHAGLFPFGGDGAGNVYCVPSQAEAGTRIYFVDHENGKVSARKEFGEWLESVVAKTLRGIRRRPPNARKVWAVQFSLPGITFPELLGLLGGVGEARAIDMEWADTTEAGLEVASAERRLEFNGRTLRVGKLEHAAWPRPLVSFDLREPLQELEQSTIRRLDSLFRERWPGYKLVDYGALDSAALEKLERDG